MWPFKKKRYWPKRDIVAEVPRLAAEWKAKLDAECDAAIKLQSRGVTTLTVLDQLQAHQSRVNRIHRHLLRLLATQRRALRNQ